MIFRLIQHFPLAKCFFGDCHSFTNTECIMSKILRNFIYAFAMITIGLFTGFKLETAFRTNAQADIDKGLRKLEQAMFFIEKNYVKEPQHANLVDDAIKGIINGLDPHSFYISASEMKSMDEQMSGNFEGIGVEYNIIDDTVYIANVIAEGPSEKAGLIAGDKIIMVNQENITGKKLNSDLVAEKLKGEKGSKVSLMVKRVGVQRLLSFTVTRDNIAIHSVEYSYMMTPKVGYIRINKFSETTYDEFIEHLTALKAEGMQQLILDLRDNPGGFMTMANRIADEFLMAGQKIVTTNGRTLESQQEYYATSTLSEFEEGALVVLMDYGSASASEILAGAIQDHDRGLILGVRSFGKGLVQVQKKFEDGSAMRIVISEYYTPSGRCIQKPYNKSHEAYEHEIEERFTSGEIYDPSKAHFPDSLKHKTDAGRTVYGGGGIFPDIFVASDTSTNSDYLLSLIQNDIFRRFAYDYIDKNVAIQERYAHAARFNYEFKADKELLRQFVKFAAGKNIQFKEADYIKSLPVLETQVKAYIGKRLFQADAYYPALHEGDVVIQKALEVMPKAAELATKCRISAMKASSK